MKRFSKSIFLTILVIAMTVALVGCKSSAKVEELEPAPAVEPAPAAEAPAAEAPAAEPEAPAAEPEAPAAEPVAEAAAEEWTITFFGYEAKISYADKVATITYPSFVTNEEILDAAAAAYAAYGAYLQGTFLEVDNGVAYLTFPVDISSEDLDAAVNMIAADLPAYIDSVLFPEINRTVEVYGFEVNVSYKDQVAKITYPAVITRAEVAEAAATAYQAYSQYLQGTELSIGDGEAYLTFPVAITEEDIDYAVALIGAYLPAYIDAVLAQAEAQEVAVVAEAPAEEAPAAAPAEEAPAAAPAEEAPAAAPAAEAPAAAPAASSTTSAPAAAASSAAAPAAQAAKKSNTGLIIVIIVLVIAACAAVAIILKKKKG